MVLFMTFRGHMRYKIDVFKSVNKLKIIMKNIKFLRTQSTMVNMVEDGNIPTIYFNNTKINTCFEPNIIDEIFCVRYNYLNCAVI